jgi:hypothetical protein
MRRATYLSTYEDPQPFSQPPGIDTAEIDIRTNLVALADSTTTRTEVFIEGTEPIPPIEVDQTAVALGTHEQDSSEAPNERVAQPRGLRSILTKLRGLGQHITLGSNGFPLGDEAGAAAAERGDLSLRERAVAAY